MMTCTEYRRWLSSYLDERLEPTQQEQLEGHLSGCAGCRKELADLRQLLTSLRALGEVEAPPDLLAGVHEKLMPTPRWRPQDVWRLLAQPRYGVAVALTAILVVFAIAIPLYLKPATRSQEKLAAKPVSTDRELRRFAKSTTSQALDEFERVDAARGNRVVSSEDHIAAPASNLVGGYASEVGAGGSAGVLERKSTSDSLGSQFVSVVQGIALISGTTAPTKEADIAAYNETVDLNAKGVGDKTKPSDLAAGVSAGAALRTLESSQAPATRGVPSATIQQIADAKNALLAPASAEEPSIPIQLQWSVADRVDATAQLAAWVAQIRGATLSAIGDRLVVQLPESRYPLLFAELVKHGTPSRLIQGGVKDKEWLKEEANERRSLITYSKKPASVAPAKEPLVTVELLLVPSAE